MINVVWFLYPSYWHRFGILNGDGEVVSKAIVSTTTSTVDF